MRIFLMELGVVAPLITIGLEAKLLLLIQRHHGLRGSSLRKDGQHHER